MKSLDVIRANFKRKSAKGRAHPCSYLFMKRWRSLYVIATSCGLTTRDTLEILLASVASGGTEIAFQPNGRGAMFPIFRVYDPEYFRKQG